MDLNECPTNDLKYLAKFFTLKGLSPIYEWVIKKKIYT